MMRSSRPPAPLPHREDRRPILGDYLAFRRNGLRFWQETGRLGPLVDVRFGAQRFWLVTDPDLAEHVLLKAVKDYPRDRRLMALNRGPGPELMFNTDRWEEWRWRRRMLTPSFRRQVVGEFGATMVAQARRTADEVLEAGRIDLQARLRAMTMRTILETMFSVTKDDDVGRLQKTFETASDVVAGRAAAPVRIPYWFPTPANLELRADMRYRWSTLAGIVKERLGSDTERGDMLDLLIAEHLEDDGRAFELADLVGEMSGIVFAGHETTAETQTWLFYLLAEHPAVEARVMDEIEAVLGERDPTLEDLPNMPFTKQVIEETMRLYPAVYVTMREADVTHEVGPYTIPAGTRLVINIRGMHLDPAAWSEPEQFDPDRFSPERSEPAHRYQFIPFLAGPKKCLGDHFAMLEMQLAVPTILQRARLSYGGDQPPRAVGGFTLGVEDGMTMIARPRSSIAA